MNKHEVGHADGGHALPAFSVKSRSADEQIHTLPKRLIANGEEEVLFGGEMTVDGGFAVFDGFSQLVHAETEITISQKKTPRFQENQLLALL
jgi:hypothetical protein